jgi:hypothetical protein
MQTLTDDQLADLWRRLWETADGVTDTLGRRQHTFGIKRLLTYYGVTVTDGYGPHAPVRADAFGRLEQLGAIERIGGGEGRRTRSLWVARPE